MSLEPKDDLPRYPGTKVRVARIPEEQAWAQWRDVRSSLVAGWEHWTDKELLALAEAPEFVVECTPLERELIVRLGALVELLEDPDFIGGPVAAP